MAVALKELQEKALALSESERARLAASILDSLPGVMADADEGIEEALRRDAELDAHPERAIPIEQLDSEFGNRRK